MARLTDWEWWAGSESSVDEDGVFELGSAATRAGAIALIDHDGRPGETYRIIEARMWERRDFDGDFMPFARVRNGEVIVAGAAVAS